MKKILIAELLFHTALLTAVFLIYLHYPEYAVPSFINDTVTGMWAIYGVIGIICVKRAIERKSARYRNRACLYFLLGGLLQVAQLY